MSTTHEIVRQNHFWETYATELQKAAAAGKYSWPADQAATVAAKMRAAWPNSSKDGVAFKATCKAIGIAHTYKAINAYLPVVWRVGSMRRMSRMRAEIVGDAMLTETEEGSAMNKPHIRLHVVATVWCASLYESRRHYVQFYDTLHHWNAAGALYEAFHFLRNYKP